MLFLVYSPRVKNSGLFTFLCVFLLFLYLLSVFCVHKMVLVNDTTTSFVYLTKANFFIIIFGFYFEYLRNNL